MEEKYLKKIGQNIKNIRKSKHISQEKLAEMIGVSRNYIGMIERAECNIPTKTLIRIALKLNIHPKTLYE